MGVNGVPFFIINGVPCFSGAQKPEDFIDAIRANLEPSGQFCKFRTPSRRRGVANKAIPKNLNS
jgi:hypothetical protein